MKKCYIVSDVIPERVINADNDREAYALIEEELDAYEEKHGLPLRVWSDFYEDGFCLKVDIDYERVYWTPAFKY